MFQTLIDCRVRTVIDSNFVKKTLSFCTPLNLPTTKITPSQKNIALTFSKAFSSSVVKQTFSAIKVENHDRKIPVHCQRIGLLTEKLTAEHVDMKKSQTTSFLLSNFLRIQVGGFL